MAYVALAKIKKNSPPAELTSDIINSTGTFPVDHLEYFRDADGVLIVDGIVIWDPADPDPAHREEVKITAASGTTGAAGLGGSLPSTGDGKMVGNSGNGTTPGAPAYPNPDGGGGAGGWIGAGSTVHAGTSGSPGSIMIIEYS